jgi:tetratricopeptide (TPR) repeat protein
MGSGGQIGQLMALGLFADARQLITNTLAAQGKDADPQLYLQRALCEFQLRMYSKAIDDCTFVINSHFSASARSSARQLRAQIYLHLGDFSNASEDAKASKEAQIIDRVTAASRAAEQVNAVVKSANLIDQKQFLDELLQYSKGATPYVLLRANLAWGDGERDLYFALTNELLEDSWDGVVHFRRGLVFLCRNDLQEARKLLRASEKMTGAAKNASIVMKSIAAFDKHKRDATRAIQNQNLETAGPAINRTMAAALKMCSRDTILVQSMSVLSVKLLRLKGEVREALDLLNKLIDLSASSLVELYLERGDIHFELEDYDAALFDYQTAQRRDGTSRRAAEGIEKATELKKEASHVDLYAILGVQASASDEEIKAAYKKKVREWHPDQFPDPDKKKEAEDMMRLVNGAFDILGDPASKRMYDQGAEPGSISTSREGQGMRPMDVFRGMGFPGFFAEGGQGAQFHFHR